jgi:hypothetical protein
MMVFKEIFIACIICPFFLLIFIFMAVLGWFYSKMTDVVVRRLKRQTVASGGEGSAALVLPDGCRNPVYRVHLPI